MTKRHLGKNELGPDSYVSDNSPSSGPYRAFYLKNWIFERIFKIGCFVNYLAFFMILPTKRHVLMRAAS